MKERPILFNTEMVKAVLDGKKYQTRRVVKPQPDTSLWKPEALLKEKEWRQRYCQGPHHHIEENMWCLYNKDDSNTAMPYVGVKCPYGQVGDRLWVRETFKPFQPHHEEGIIRGYQYKADKSFNYIPPLAEDEGCLINKIGSGKWKPSIHMPRAACRITLEIVNIKIERVQDITHDDALAEGIEHSLWEYSCEPYRNYNEPRMAPGRNCSSARTSFYTLWNSINEKRGFSWNTNPWVWVVELKQC